MSADIEVLVVEDDPATRQLIAAAFSTLPGLHLCGMARDGLEGLALIDQLHPHAVLLDLVMPVLDGLEVLRQLSQRPRAPMVVVTSQVCTQQVVQCALSLGASYYLVKPVNIQTLPHLLESLCITPLMEQATALLESMEATGMGVQAAAWAAAVLHQSPHALLKEAYAPTIAHDRTSYASVEKNIRVMVDKLHTASSAGYVALMGGLPSHRPSNLVFLRALSARIGLD